MKTYELEFSMLVREYYRCEIEAESFEEATQLFNGNDTNMDHFIDSEVKEVELDEIESIFRNKDIIDENEMKELKEKYNI